METYLLPCLVFFPVLYRLFPVFRPEFLFSPLIYTGALVFMCLTALCALTGSKIEWILCTIPLGAQRPLVTMGLAVDELSGVISTTVLIIGAVVTRFSFKYLEDDPLRTQFMKNLSWTMSSVLVMLMSQNLILFFLSWVATSYFLHQLLTHFNHRADAIKAARQKFWISRVGDFFIVSSSLLIFYTFKNFDFDIVFRTVREPDFLNNHFFEIHLASFLLIFGAMAKSAQFPFHFWLPQTMETPTPVSAIMHAGIINAGGYLIIRMSPLLASAPMSLSLLTFVGGFTTFYAVLIMLTQTNIKKSLAYSTIAQMGFMMLQCGLGAFSLAVLHIIGHAFYKAYVFLSSGTATDFGRLHRSFPDTKQSASLWAPYIVGSLSLVGVFGTAVLTGFQLFDRPGESILLFIFSLALAQIALVSEQKLLAVLTALGVGFAYKILGSGMEHFLRDTVSAAPTFSVYETALYLIILPLFTILYLVQNNLELINQSAWGQKLYVKFYSGGFFEQ